MRLLFQFTTAKPSASVIWANLSNHEIEAVGGYTADQIRFYMFVVLQLRTDFKSAKELCNNYTSRVNELHVALRNLLNLPTAQSSSSFKFPPVGFTDWVEPELYAPYYMLKQLGVIKAKLWKTLFDRELYASDNEILHLHVDLKPLSKSITAYKLWYYGNDIITEKYSDIFEVVNTDGYMPIPIYGKVELISELNKYMYDYLTDSDSHIYDYSHKLSISSFTLGVSDAPQ